MRATGLVTKRAARAAYTAALDAARRGQREPPPPFAAFHAALEATARAGQPAAEVRRIEVPQPAAPPAPPADAPAPPPPALRKRSVTVAVVGDVHFPSHSEPHWRAFREWHSDTRPDWLVLNGDMLDFAALSRFEKGSDDPTDVLGEIKIFVREVNELARECGRITLNVGNHEARFSKAVGGPHAQALKGLLGLDLHSLLLRHGLTEKLEWKREGVGFRGVEIGDVLARHGDRQAGRFSGKYVAATALSKSIGRHVAVSHHHKGQLHAETFEDRTVFGVAVPCMAAELDYAPGASWVRGFAVFELDDAGAATPYVVVMHAKTGRFCYGGRVYGG